MGNSIRPDGDITKLHPAIRGRVEAIRKKLQSEGIKFDVFEAFRTPERQAALYAKGRPHNGPKVTWVKPWGSIHQYGLAVDFVLKDGNGNWSWDTSGDNMAKWHRMHDLAKENGMTPLYNSKGKLIELPHIQLKDIKSKQLYQGTYPTGGDDAWADRLNEIISNWEGSPAAPPRPVIEPGGVRIAPELMASMEAEEGGDTQIAAVITDPKFQKLHSFIKQAEGGFANLEGDTGGPTNFGITQATLASWRGKDVSEADVQNMTQEEADAILYTNYYVKSKCDKMKDRTAMVVYNMAVHSGPRRAQEVLQEAFNDLGMTANGGPLEVDGVVGPITLGAINQTDASVLADKYLELYEAHLRSRDNFDTFEAGWIKRVNKLRVFLNALPKGEGKRPRTIMKPIDLLPDVDRDDALQLAMLVATGGKSAVGKALISRVLRNRISKKLESSDSVTSDLLGHLIEEKLGDDDDDTPRSKRLTPVNKALGEGIGRVLNGKKSVIGIVGLIAAAVVPELGLTASDPQITNLLDGDNQTIIFTLLSIFTGWGFLGKIDKAIRDVRS